MSFHVLPPDQIIFKNFAPVPSSVVVFNWHSGCGCWLPSAGSFHHWPPFRLFNGTIHKFAGCTGRGP